MADNTNGNPWYFDTTGVKATGQLGVTWIKWISPSANAGDLALVQDSAGNTIFDSVASGGNYESLTRYEKRYTGLNVVTLSSGRLQVLINVQPTIF
jgi:hypothetical protein